MSLEDYQNEVLDIAAKTFKRDPGDFNLDMRWIDDLKAHSRHIVKILALVKMRHPDIAFGANDLTQCLTLGDLASALYAASEA